MKRSGRTVLFVVGVLIVLLVLAAVPPLLYQNNPPVQQEPAWDSPQTRALAVRACFDCHSDQTRWPWFTKIPPGSWLAVFDTIRGRRHLNFSQWGTAQGRGERGERGGRDIAEVIRNGSMPPGNYTMLHPDAVLNAQEQQQLIQGLQNSLK